jgi:hypothetical protein
MLLHVPVSAGELLDKLAILEIKAARIRDPRKLANVHRELEALRAAWQAAPARDADLGDLLAELRAVNEALWDIEDAIRARERAQAFDEEFIRLARSVYLTNDRRAAIKRALNERLGSTLVEEKSYEPPGHGVPTQRDHGGIRTGSRGRSG